MIYFRYIFKILNRNYVIFNITQFLLVSLYTSMQVHNISKLQNTACLQRGGPRRGGGVLPFTRTPPPPFPKSCIRPCSIISQYVNTPFVGYVGFVL